MRMALCRPSSQRVFQKMPGRRSTQGTVLVVTKWLTGGVVTGAVSFRPISAAGVTQGLLDGVAELLEGQGPSIFRWLMKKVGVARTPASRPSRCSARTA